MCTFKKNIEYKLCEYKYMHVNILDLNVFIYTYNVTHTLDKQKRILNAINHN